MIQDKNAKERKVNGKIYCTNEWLNCDSFVQKTFVEFGFFVILLCYCALYTCMECTCITAIVLVKLYCNCCTTDVVVAIDKLSKYDMHTHLVVAGFFLSMYLLLAIQWSGNWCKDDFVPHFIAASIYYYCCWGIVVHTLVCLRMCVLFNLKERLLIVFACK